MPSVRQGQDSLEGLRDTAARALAQKNVDPKDRVAAAQTLVIVAMLLLGGFVAFWDLILSTVVSFLIK